MDTSPQLVELPPGLGIAIRERVPLSQLPAFFGAAFAELGTAGGSQMTGPPFAIYHAFDQDAVDVSAAMPVRSRLAPAGRAVPIELAGGPAVQVEHVGPYDELSATYGAIEKWIAQNHRRRAGAPREIYMTMPTVPPSQQVTLVVQPLEPS
jgi:effector-binding domain-containing protein